MPEAVIVATARTPIGRAFKGSLKDLRPCPLNDGAAAAVVMSDTKARELGLTPLARIVATGVSALSPEIMGYGPVEASRQALARAGSSGTRKAPVT